MANYFRFALLAPITPLVPVLPQQHWSLVLLLTFIGFAVLHRSPLGILISSSAYYLLSLPTPATDTTLLPYLITYHFTTLPLLILYTSSASLLVLIPFTLL